MSLPRKTFGLVVNPRNGRPFGCDRTKLRTVQIFDLNRIDGDPNADAPVEGEGYFEQGSDDEHGQSAQITGFPRVHTPSGVRSKGEGNGTCLYTALCLAAAMDDDGDLSFCDLEVSGQGISSNSHRSRSAGEWWEAAKERFGLAHEVTKELSVEFEDESVRVRRGEFELIEQILEGSVGHNVSVTSATVTADGTHYEEASADAYPYAKAVEKHLVVYRMQHRSRAAEFEEVDVAMMDLVDERALACVSFAGCDDWNAFHIAAKLVDLARRSGLPRAVVDGMEVRLLTREGELGSGEHWSSHYDPTRNPRRNPSPPPRISRRVVEQELAAVARRRASLGWGAFAVPEDARANPRRRSVPQWAFAPGRRRW